MVGNTIVSSVNESIARGYSVTVFELPVITQQLVKTPHTLFQISFRSAHSSTSKQKWLG
jgi:hypothetical protein